MGVSRGHNGHQEPGARGTDQDVLGQISVGGVDNSRALGTPNWRGIVLQPPERRQISYYLLAEPTTANVPSARGREMHCKQADTPSPSAPKMHPVIPIDIGGSARQGHRKPEALPRYFQRSACAAYYWSTSTARVRRSKTKPSLSLVLNASGRLSRPVTVQCSL